MDGSASVQTDRETALFTLDATRIGAADRDHLLRASSEEARRARRPARGGEVRFRGQEYENLWERVHLLGEAQGANLASYDGRHQWARDAVDDGTDYLKLIKAGGWKAGSRMVERYYGEKEIANEGVHLKR